MEKLWLLFRMLESDRNVVYEIENWKSGDACHVVLIMVAKVVVYGHHRLDADVGYPCVLHQSSDT